MVNNVTKSHTTYLCTGIRAGIMRTQDGKIKSRQDCIYCLTLMKENFAKLHDVISVYNVAERKKYILSTSEQT